MISFRCRYASPSRSCRKRHLTLLHQLQLLRTEGRYDICCTLTQCEFDLKFVQHCSKVLSSKRPARSYALHRRRKNKPARCAMPHEGRGSPYLLGILHHHVDLVQCLLPNCHISDIDDVFMSERTQYGDLSQSGDGNPMVTLLDRDAHLFEGDNFRGLSISGAEYHTVGCLVLAEETSPRRFGPRTAFAQSIELLERPHGYALS